MLECIMHHILSYFDSYQHWCLAYICEGIFDLHIFITITSPYTRDRGVITSNPYYMKDQGLRQVWSLVLSLFDARANFDIAGIFSHNPWRRWTSWASSTLSWWLWDEEPLSRVIHTVTVINFLHHFKLCLSRDISDTGQNGDWNIISCIWYPRGVCTWRPSAGAFVPLPCHRGVFCFQIGDDGVPPPRWSVEA